MNDNNTIAGKQLILGWDFHGRPCHYMNPSKQNTPRSDRQIEHLVFMLEREIDLMVPGQETLALLINFAETKSGQGASIGQGRQTLNILQNHYPERLGRALVTNGELGVSVVAGLDLTQDSSVVHMELLQADHAVHRPSDTREAQVQ